MCNLMFSLLFIQIQMRRILFCVVANMLDCDLKVSKFKLQLHYYIDFRT